ncbi:MAG: 50S ribosomal protein L29 [bacterium TMED217]|nr:MAG: 50S ribosomal protein L29 [bacterium TMED217]|tara:strand:- start:21176 stop:21388 length:213 start_codon:yes stop_codon:yes gene_type:complete
MSDKNKNDSSISDLIIQLDENEQSLQNLRFQKSMQQLEDLSQIKKVKKKIARIKTIIHENALKNKMKSDG